MKKVNYVYIVDDYLRHLEREFSKGISEELPPEWASWGSVLKCRPKAVNVTFFIYRKAHIMMSHGLADKNYLIRPNRYGDYEVNKYKYVCVPGNWLKRKLLSTPGITLNEDQIVVVGWPRIDTLLEAAKNYKDRNDKVRTGKNIKVLWAPTHSGGQKDGIYLSSYPGLLQYEEALTNEFDYDRSLHPLIEKPKKSTFEKLLEADVVIADRGTLVYEAWALGKPVIFPDWLIREGNLTKGEYSAESYIFENNIGLHAKNFDELLYLIKNEPKICKSVESFMSDYLEPKTYGKSYELLAEVVQKVWSDGDLSANKK